MLKNLFYFSDTNGALLSTKGDINPTMAIKEGTQLKTEDVTGDSTEAKDEYEPLPGKWLIASLVMRFCKFAT